MVNQIQKTDKNSEYRRSKNSYLLRDLMNFKEISGKNVCYDDVKSDSKTKLYTLFS